MGMLLRVEIPSDDRVTWSAEAAASAIGKPLFPAPDDRAQIGTVVAARVEDGTLHLDIEVSSALVEYDLKHNEVHRVSLFWSTVVSRMTTARQIAEPNTILRCEAGSSVFGLNLHDASDRDELGVCIEPAEYVVGLRHFEQWVYRDQPDGYRSGDGDLDLTVYGLRKWATLALKGNPTVLLLLFVPRENCSTWTPAAERLQAMAPSFASKKAASAFLGYMQQQRARLQGGRGQMRVKRPELIDAHGFDTKYAGHILRLGFQGVEFLETGRIGVPMPEEARAKILACRRGEMDENEALTLAGELEAELKASIDSSPLPDEPDYDAVNEWLVNEYTHQWVYRR